VSYIAHYPPGAGHLRTGPDSFAFGQANGLRSWPSAPGSIALYIVDEPQAAHCEPWFNEQAESSLELGQRFRPVSMTDSLVTDLCAVNECGAYRVNRESNKADR